VDVPYDHIEDFAEGASGDELTVDIGGEEYVVEENFDLDGDGRNDTAVVEAEDGGALAFADTDGDGVADVAVEYDANGDVVAGAEYDETTGEWHEEDVEALPTPTGDGADDTTGTDSAETSSDTDYEPGEDDMTVDVPGEDVNAGPATYDTDGDGRNDTAVVADEDGTTYVFTDTDNDGEADEAAVVTPDGDVTIATHTGDDEWTVTDEGHLNPDGTYDSTGEHAAAR
jgi:hypothetical protein